MNLSVRSALKDIRQNRFLNVVTVITMALSSLIVSSFALFFLNLSAAASGWRDGIRIMAYLKKDMNSASPGDLEKRINVMHGVFEIKFIPKEEAISRLQKRMTRQSYLFDVMEKNPLPDAFEIRIDPDIREMEDIEALANRIESIEQVEEVEYGQKWVDNFSVIFKVLSLAGYAMGGFFFAASLLIVANTTRLTLYSRRKEIEITRLVGGSDNFIKTPLYIESLMQGAAGGIVGLATLFIIYTLALSSSFIQELGFGLFQLNFFSLKAMALILFCAISVGWLGCYISIKQHLKA